MNFLKIQAYYVKKNLIPFINCICYSQQQFAQLFGVFKLHCFKKKTRNKIIFASELKNIFSKRILAQNLFMKIVIFLKSAFVFNYSFLNFRFFITLHVHLDTNLDCQIAFLLSYLLIITLLFLLNSVL